MHGGASTGPRIAEGLARSRPARWKHGLYCAENPSGAKAGARTANPELRAPETDASELNRRLHGARFPEVCGQGSGSAFHGVWVAPATDTYV